MTSKTMLQCLLGSELLGFGLIGFFVFGGGDGATVALVCLSFLAGLGCGVALTGVGVLRQLGGDR